MAQRWCSTNVDGVTIHDLGSIYLLIVLCLTGWVPLVFHFPFSLLTFLTNPCCGTSCAQEFLTILHNSHISPPQSHPGILMHVQTCKDKEVNTPWGSPCPDGSWWKNAPTLSWDSFEVHSAQLLKGPQKDYILAALSSNQLKIYPSTGFHTTPVSLYLTTIHILKLLPKISCPQTNPRLRLY